MNQYHTYHIIQLLCVPRTHSCVSLQLSVIADDGVICTIYTEYIAGMAVGETRSSPLPQPINYGHTGDKKGKIFLLTLYITCLVWYYECLFCYESKERRKEQNFGCMSESRKNLRFVHLLTSPCLSIKYWTFSIEKTFFLFLRHVLYFLELLHLHVGY